MQRTLPRILPSADLRPSRFAIVALLSLCAACDQDAAACVDDTACDLSDVCVDGRCEPSPELDAGAAGVDAGPDDLAPFDAGVASDAGAGDAGPSCRSIEARGQVVRRAADILLVVDSSSSMGASRAQIESVIDSDFASILDASMIDYRVIAFADVSVFSLSGTLASRTPRRLFPINLGTGSGAGANFTLLLDNYGVTRAGPPPTYEEPWSNALRSDATKIFVHFTDATSSDGSTIDGYADNLEDALRALDPVMFRDVVYHSFTGVAPNAPASSPYEPGDPVVSAACSASGFTPLPGEGYQRLAMRTGGLRFPVCEFAAYDSVFRRLADAVIDETAVECAFTLPTPPAGESLDLETVAVTVTEAGSREVFRQTDASSCDASTFVIDETAGTLELCPEACARVQAAPADTVALEIAFGCDPDLI